MIHPLTAEQYSSVGLWICVIRMCYDLSVTGRRWTATFNTQSIHDDAISLTRFQRTRWIETYQMFLSSGRRVTCWDDRTPAEMKGEPEGDGFDRARSDVLESTHVPRSIDRSILLSLLSIVAVSHVETGRRRRQDLASYFYSGKKPFVNHTPEPRSRSSDCFVPFAFLSSYRSKGAL